MEKCGKIMLSNKTKFILVCAFCNDEFNEMLSFGNHVHQDHLKLDNNEFEDLKETSTKSSLDFIQLPSEALISRISLTQDSLSSIKVEIDPELETNTAQSPNGLSYVPVEAIYTPAISEHENYTNLDELNSITPKRKGQHSKKSYSLSQSPELFANETDRNFHTQSHTSNIENDSIKIIKNDIFKCEDCDRQFRTRPQLVQHTRIHTGRKNHICPHCSKRFIVKQELVTHIRTHTGERPFKCTHCPAAFKCKMNLNTHIRRHLGEKRYACNICDKRFVQSTEVKIHMRSHTGEKPYQCEECGASYTTSSALVAHKRRHSNTRNHKCEICGKEFFDKTDLKDHSIVHSKERPFQCEICSVRYPRRRALREHMKIHSSVKKYICTICSKAFAQYAGLYSHMKSHGAKLGRTMKVE